MGLLKIKNIDLTLHIKKKTKHDVVKKNRKILGLSIENKPAKVVTREKFCHQKIKRQLVKESHTCVINLDERKTHKAKKHI